MKPAISPLSGLAVSVVATLALCFPAAARADLAWTRKDVELKVDAGTAVAEARFPFKNTGVKPVDVNQVMSSCGCTTVNLEKRHYEPGETGEIVARYTVANAVGVQKKSVLVTTSDGGDPVELNLSVDIPQVLRITPAFVTWTHNETPQAKQVTVEMVQDTPIKDIAVQSSSGVVSAELETVTKGRKYLITIKPNKTDQHLFSTVTIQCKFGDTERVFRTYGTVQPPTKEE